MSLISIIFFQKIIIIYETLEEIVDEKKELKDIPKNVQA
jgi:hypothetical protein